MKLPNIKIEKKLLAINDYIVGVDEAGRGPLAGPVVAGAMRVNPEALESDFELRGLVRDSKKLSEKQRDEIFDYIKKNDNFVFGIGVVSNEMIDRINILNATLLAMRVAVDNLVGKLKVENQHPEFNGRRMCLLVDGNRKIEGVKYGQKLFPRGDRDIFSIAAASICAKVHRDGLMKEYELEFPGYAFCEHKGYGTRKHIQNLIKNGPCEIHRKSFGPVKELLRSESEKI